MDIIIKKKKACAMIIIALLLKKRIKRKRWMRSWLQRRDHYTHLNLINEIRVQKEDEDFENYYRMKEACYDQLLQMAKPYLTRQDTCMRKAITAEERLAVTLRYLATGRNIQDLKYSAIMSPAAISQSIIETCEVLIYVLQCYMEKPTQEEWERIAAEFGDNYQFWNCLGGLDGKHVKIQKPEHSGSLYYNYKGHYSIVLMALANANKEFIMIDVGANGRVSDGGVLFYSKFWDLYSKGELNIPEPSPLPNTRERFPFVFISDEAFALGINLMKPYPQSACMNESANSNERKVFNSRLSRARSVIEGAFGIITKKFGVFQKTICLEPQKAAVIVTACCYLHNYLMKTAPRRYLASNWKVTESYETELHDLEPTSSRNSTNDAKSIREKFCHYFSHEGKLDIRKYYQHE